MIQSCLHNEISIKCWMSEAWMSLLVGDINVSRGWCVLRMQKLCIWDPPKTPLCISSFAAAAKSLRSCLTLCNPIDGSTPGSVIPGILQARTLEWVAFGCLLFIFFNNKTIIVSMCFPEYCESSQPSIEPEGVVGTPELVDNWSEVLVTWRPQRW